MFKLAGVLEDCLNAGSREMGIRLSQEKITVFRTYYEILSQENEKYNLTSIEGEREVAVKHFLDSLACVSVLDFKNTCVVDVGTGAGFPGLPLKIFCPEMEILLVDSVKKKVAFLEDLVERLGITGVSVRWDRAETMGVCGEFREKADIVVSRAVAPLNVLAEICLPLVSPGGHFLSMKGPGAGEEIFAATRAIEMLGGRLGRSERIKLPIGNDERTLVLIKKVGHTPKGYPRRPGMPAKKPLGG